MTDRLQHRKTQPRVLLIQTISGNSTRTREQISRVTSAPFFWKEVGGTCEKLVLGDQLDVGCLSCPLGYCAQDAIVSKQAHA